MFFYVGERGYRFAIRRVCFIWARFETRLYSSPRPLLATSIRGRNPLFILEGHHFIDAALMASTFKISF